MIKIIQENKKIKGYDADIVDVVQMYFENGGTIEEYDDWASEEGDTPETKRRYEEYIDLINLGPSGFLEKFEDDLDFDNSYVDEYGSSYLDYENESIFDTLTADKFKENIDYYTDVIASDLQDELFIISAYCEDYDISMPFYRLYKEDKDNIIKDLHQYPVSIITFCRTLISLCSKIEEKTGDDLEEDKSFLYDMIQAIEKWYKEK